MHPIATARFDKLVFLDVWRIFFCIPAIRPCPISEALRQPMLAALLVRRSGSALHSLYAFPTIMLRSCRRVFPIQKLRSRPELVLQPQSDINAGMRCRE